MKYLNISIFILFFAYSSFAQFPGAGGKTRSNIVGKITGHVLDSTSQNPVEFATIALRRNGFDKDIDGTISDEEGNFTIPNLKPGTYDINITFIGYNPKLITGIELTLKNPDDEVGAIQLQTNQVLLETVKIEGQRALIENKVDRLVYNAENDATVKGGDAADGCITQGAYAQCRHEWECLATWFSEFENSDKWQAIRYLFRFHSRCIKNDPRR